MPTPESIARQHIDDLLTACGWVVQDRAAHLRQAILKRAFEGRLVEWEGPAPQAESKPVQHSTDS